MHFATLTTATLVLGTRICRVGAAAASRAPARLTARAVFKRACASCHQAGQTAVPPPDALRAITPEAIVTALTNGRWPCRAPRSVRPSIPPSLSSSPAARPSQRPRPAHSPIAARAPRRRPIRRAVQAGRHGADDATNGRNVPKGGITAADLPKLKLKWAFGYNGSTSARVQPAVAGGKLFVASDNAELLALDPEDRLRLLVLQGGVRDSQRPDRRPVQDGRAERLRGVLR